MAAKVMGFSWWYSGSTISANSDVIWGMSAKVMVAMTARLIALLMLTAIAAAAAKRNKDATEKLCANKLFAMSAAHYPDTMTRWNALNGARKRPRSRLLTPPATPNGPHVWPRVRAASASSGSVARSARSAARAKSTAADWGERGC